MEMGKASSGADLGTQITQREAGTLWTGYMYLTETDLEVREDPTYILVLRLLPVEFPIPVSVLSHTTIVKVELISQLNINKTEILK